MGDMLWHAMRMWYIGRMRVAAALDSLAGTVKPHDKDTWR